TFSYLDNDGASQSINFAAIVQDNETLTSLYYDISLQQLSYSDEKSDVTNIDLKELVGNSVQVTNGLNKDSGHIIRLGGTLTEPTSITADATNTLSISGLESGTIVDNVMVTDASTGQVKALDPSLLMASNYSTDEQTTGKTWINGADVYWKTIEFTQASNSAVFALGAAAGFTATQILNIKLLHKDTNIIVSNIKSYDLSTNTLVVGSGTTSYVQPSGDYYIIIEYLK
ncbi:hypothetical protein, partial [Echinicola pacifica]